ncbi:uncharacterized protein LOC141685699 [Apium graveolens]|uniref:uncharacterized protein LOC141685699 n=1 Tax=Apium graveolens TaxID=4045 RepID=UPI003D7BDD6E
MKQVYVPRAKRFKFENTWIREQDCRGVVKQGWERAGCGTVLEKIRSCGSILQEWGGGEKNRRYKQQVQDCKKSLRKLQSRRDAAVVKQYSEIRNTYLKLLERQEIYWKQRAKQHWLREGDRNIRYFHRFASTRKKNNSIDRIKNANGRSQRKAFGM